MLLFTGGAGSRKRRLVADGAEAEPKDGPCPVGGFMGPDIPSGGTGVQPHRASGMVQEAAGEALRWRLV